MLRCAERKDDLGHRIETWAADEYDLDIDDLDDQAIIDYPGHGVEVKSCKRWNNAPGYGRQGRRRRGAWKGTWRQLDHLEEIGGRYILVVYELRQKATEEMLNAIEENVVPIAHAEVAPELVERNAYSDRSTAKEYWTLPWTRIFPNKVAEA